MAPPSIMIPGTGYLYEPKEDITAYELALILPIVTTVLAHPGYNSYRDYFERHFEALPEKAKRHFRPQTGRG